MREYINLGDATQAMRSLYEDDVNQYGADIPECFDYERAIEALEYLPRMTKPEDSMRKYMIKYCCVSDCRDVKTLDKKYDTYDDALKAVLHLEEDPDIYTAWQEEVYE